jgi:indole-3-glycerol phosphate synthase
MSNFIPERLVEIRERKLREVQQLTDPSTIEPGEWPRPTNTFLEAVSLTPDHRVNLIAEFVRRGEVVRAYKLDKLVREVAHDSSQNGLRAVSLLTDVDYGGNHDYRDLAKVRAATQLPLLHMDFIVDPKQVQLARQFGADAVLLLAPMLETSSLRDLLQTAEECGLEVLVEINDLAQLNKAQQAGAKIIGINNYHWASGAIDLSITAKLAREIEAHIPLVSESGIKGREQVQYILDATEGRVTAILVGSVLMQQKSLAALRNKIRELTGFERGAH